MCTEGFDIVSHTADLAIQVRSHTLVGLLRQAISGMLCLLTDPDKVGAKKTAQAEISFESPEAFIVRSLNKALYLFDAEGFLSKTVSVDFCGADPTDILANQPASNKVFTAKLAFFGEQINKERHQIKHCVKAATYHNLLVSNEGHNLMATIILDD